MTPQINAMPALSHPRSLLLIIALIMSTHATDPVHNDTLDETLEYEYEYEYELDIELDICNTNHSNQTSSQEEHLEGRHNYLQSAWNQLNQMVAGNSNVQHHHQKKKKKKGRKRKQPKPTKVVQKVTIPTTRPPVTDNYRPSTRAPPSRPPKLIVKKDKCIPCTQVPPDQLYKYRQVKAKSQHKQDKDKNHQQQQPSIAMLEGTSTFGVPVAVATSADTSSGSNVLSSPLFPIHVHHSSPDQDVHVPPVGSRVPVDWSSPVGGRWAPAGSFSTRPKPQLEWTGQLKGSGNSVGAIIHSSSTEQEVGPKWKDFSSGQAASSSTQSPDTGTTDAADSNATTNGQSSSLVPTAPNVQSPIQSSLGSNIERLLESAAANSAPGQPTNIIAPQGPSIILIGDGAQVHRQMLQALEKMDMNTPPQFNGR